jgi:hypothetical protein
MRIGLVAGEGRLPAIFADAAKEKGDTVIAFALKGVAGEELAGHVDKIHWLEWGDLKKGILLLAMERIGHIVLLGKIKKELFFKGAPMDEDARTAMKKIGDKKDYAILNEVTNVLSKVGIKVMDPTGYLTKLIPAKGILTKREPLESEWADINYGQLVAKSLSGFDVGQTIVLKDKTVIAVEAMEGTDETIRRAGSFTKGGFTAVKVARPNQDMRFDIPLVGLDTLKALAEAGGKVLALEADKMLLMDKEEIIKFADEKDISIAVI